MKILSKTNNEIIPIPSIIILDIHLDKFRRLKNISWI